MRAVNVSPKSAVRSGSASPSKVTKESAGSRPAESQESPAADAAVSDVPVDAGAAGTEGSGDAGGIGLFLKQARDFLERPMPDDEKAQIVHFRTFAGGLEFLRSAKVEANAQTARMLPLMKSLMTEPGAGEDLIRLKAEYSARMSGVLELSKFIDEVEKAYVERIRALLPQLTIDVLTAGVIDVCEPFQGAATMEDALAAHDATLRSISKLHSALTSADLPPLAPEARKKIDEWRLNAISRTMHNCLIRTEAIRAEQEISELSETFPADIRTPIRYKRTPEASGDSGESEAKFRRMFADAKQQYDLCRLALQCQDREIADFLRRALVGSGGVDALEKKRNQFAEVYGVFSDKLVGHDAIEAELEKLLAALDHSGLDQLILKVRHQLESDNGLVWAPALYVNIHRLMANTYADMRARQLEKEESRTRSSTAKSSARGRGNKPAARRGRGRKAPAARSNPASKGQRSAATVERGQTDEVSAPIEIVTPTTIEKPGGAKWTVVGAPPTWTEYTPLGSDKRVSLRDTSRIVESRARNLWNWDKASMGGPHTHLPAKQTAETRSLGAEECVALIDWIVSSRSGDRRVEDKLPGGPYRIVCSKGTGDFADRYQLKVINMDDDVPGLGQDWNNNAPRKRPTFHIDVANDAVHQVEQALALRGLGDAIV